jgi:hypothetical protein
LAQRPKNKPHLQSTFADQLRAKSGPRISEPVEAVARQRPMWRIGSLDVEGPWGWHDASGDHLRQILDRLKCFETMTWSEIENAKSCGTIEIAAVCPEAQSRLVELRRDDVDVLYKLRVTSAGRVWGIKTGAVLELLWWDPDHTVYPMNTADN